MALENLTPENRVERLLSGADLEPATRLEYFLKQAGSGGGGSVPTPTAADTGKVLTVVSEYETGAEAIPAQTVTIAQGTATVQNANVSQWTEGQSLQVIYRGTTYTGQITDAEGALVFGTADFALIYDSSTGVLTVEDNKHSGDNTISAHYVTEHADADWAEPSGSGSIPLLEQSEPFYVPDLVNGGTRLLDPSDVSLEIYASVNDEYIQLNENVPVYFSEISPPFYVGIHDLFVLSISWENVPVTTKENNLHHPAYVVNTGYFVSVTLLGRSDRAYILVVNPNDVVYMNTTDR